MLVTKYLLPFALLPFAISASAQKTSLQTLDSISSALISRIKNIRTEEIHITTDKSVYKPGEPVWFRLFILNSASKRLSKESNKVIVELVNEDNHAMHHMIMHTDISNLSVRLFLPKDLPTGHYWLRAFTTNTNAVSVGDITDEPVYVYNAENNKNVSVKNIPAPAVLKIYPEGGNIITGASSRLALRVMNREGYPLSDTGFVRDEHGGIAGRFVSNTYGLAPFEFEPSKYRRYYASVSKDGVDSGQALPLYSPNAVQLSIASQNGFYKARVLLEDSVKSDLETYLIGVSADSIAFGSIGTGNYELNISQENLPHGVTTFFLFDKTMNLLSERSIYQQSGLQSEAALNKNIYDKNEKVNIAIDISEKGKPVLASFSVAVNNSEFVHSLQKNDITPTEWSLTQRDNLTQDEANLFMLTKQNVYESFKDNKTMVPISGMNSDSLFFIHGTLTDKDDNPVAGKAISLFSKTGDNFFQTDTTDEKGRFSFSLTDYADSTLFTLKVLNNPGKGQGWKLKTDEFKFPEENITFSGKRKFEVGEKAMNSVMDSIQTSQNKIMLQPVNVNDKRAAVVPHEKKRISNFSHIIEGKDIQNSGSGTVGNAIIGVGGLKLLNGFLIFGGPSNFSGVDASMEPLIVVDGVNIAVAMDGTGTSPVLKYLNSLSPRTIDYIEVLTGPEAASYGIRSSSGVIVINTTNDYRQDHLDSKGNISMTFYATGYSAPVAFTQSVDSKSAPGNSTGTVYWNGNVLTDKNGKAFVSFYANGSPGNYIITIRGVTDNGHVIYKRLSYDQH